MSKIYVWTLGNDDRPATDQDIKEAEETLNSKIPEFKNVVYNHTLRLVGVLEEAALAEDTPEKYV